MYFFRRCAYAVKTCCVLDGGGLEEFWPIASLRVGGAPNAPHKAAQLAQDEEESFTEGGKRLVDIRIDGVQCSQLKAQTAQEERGLGSGDPDWPMDSSPPVIRLCSATSDWSSLLHAYIFRYIGHFGYISTCSSPM